MKSDDIGRYWQWLKERKATLFYSPRKLGWAVRDWSHGWDGKQHPFFPTPEEAVQAAIDGEEV